MPRLGLHELGLEAGDVAARAAVQQLARPVGHQHPGHCLCSHCGHGVFRCVASSSAGVLCQESVLDDCGHRTGGGLPRDRGRVPPPLLLADTGPGLL